MAMFNIPDYLADDPTVESAINAAIRDKMLEHAVRDVIASLLRDQGFFTNMMVLARLVDDKCRLDMRFHRYTSRDMRNHNCGPDDGSLALYEIKVDGVRMCVKPYQLAAIVDNIATEGFGCRVFGSSPMAEDTTKIYAR